MASSATAYQGTIDPGWITALDNIVKAADQSTFRFDTSRFEGGVGPKSTQSTYAVGGSYFERTVPTTRKQAGDLSVPEDAGNISCDSECAPLEECRMYHLRVRR